MFLTGNREKNQFQCVTHHCWVCRLLKIICSKNQRIIDFYLSVISFSSYCTILLCTFLSKLLTFTSINTAASLWKNGFNTLNISIILWDKCDDMLIILTFIFFLICTAITPWKLSQFNRSIPSQEASLPGLWICRSYRFRWLRKIS